MCFTCTRECKPRHIVFYWVFPDSYCSGKGVERESLEERVLFFLAFKFFPMFIVSLFAFLVNILFWSSAIKPRLCVGPLSINPGCLYAVKEKWIWYIQYLVQFLMNTYRSISWNINGIHNPMKRKQILTYIKRNRTDLCFIQETHLNSKEHWKCNVRFFLRTHLFQLLYYYF